MTSQLVGKERVKCTIVIGKYFRQMNLSQGKVLVSVLQQLEGFMSFRLEDCSIYTVC